MKILTTMSLFLILVFSASMSFGDNVCTVDLFKNKKLPCASGRSYESTCDCKFDLLRRTELNCRCLGSVSLPTFVDINSDQCKETATSKVDIVNRNGVVTCERQ